jgi:phosphoribosylaminoimidazole carboxylase PurE protein
MKQVLILMGSDSDLPVMVEVPRVLREFGVEFEMRVLSVHRSPEKAMETAVRARASGFRVIIAAAGSAAHLAGAIAAKTTLPVIGVPIESGALRGVDALYSTVQMPPGVPVATVAINGARNAGLLAVEILALSDERLQAALERHKQKLVEQVDERDRKLQERLREEGLA